VGVALCALFVLGLGATAAHAATLTYPTDGQTVTLDETGNFTFRWTFAPGENYADITEGDSPTMANGSVWGVCLDHGVGDTSCRVPFQIAGTHYAVLSASSQDGSNTDSPPVKFVVPVVFAWGCPGGSCEGPKGWFAKPSLTIPQNSGAGAEVWDNVPGSTLTATLVVRHGRRVVKRLQETQTDGGRLGPTQFNVVLRFFHIRGLRARTPLQATFTVAAAGRTLTKNLKLRAP
jgi:hypothetical protein